MRDPIPDQIIERAVELWCRLLRSPDFDNGDRGFTSSMASWMASASAETAAAEVDIEAAIERFRTALIADLKFIRDHEGQPTGEIRHQGKPGEYAVTHYFPRELSCDYDPCSILAEAADAAGLPRRLFSWKTHVGLLQNMVQVQAGYGASSEYHYPMPDGRWLVTEVADRGGSKDMQAIIAAVMDGRLDLRVDGEPLASTAEGV